MSNKNSKTYQVIGLMSGSSLDGLDIAFCELKITDSNSNIDWTLIKAETIPYPEKWQNRLINLPKQDGFIFAQTHTYFGHFLGELVNQFISKHQIDPDFIASHGHTIFHHPDKRLTVQIGDGAALAATTGYPVINGFRTQDIAINGEGTPIAPAADRYLLKGFDFYLNIGGIANITCDTGSKYIAFDTGPANQILNSLAQLLGHEFDEDGKFAAKGQLLPDLLSQIDQVEYFQQAYPKSLDNQWIRQNVLPLYLSYEASIEDKLHTACVQLARQTALSIQQILQKENINKNSYNMLVSGGGALNQFLMTCFEKYCKDITSMTIEIPNKEIILFKEAILMALMGVLRIENKPNCFASVTGANWDTIGGAVHQGKKKMI